MRREEGGEDRHGDTGGRGRHRHREARDGRAVYRGGKESKECGGSIGTRNKMWGARSRKQGRHRYGGARHMGHMVGRRQQEQQEWEEGK